MTSTSASEERFWEVAERYLSEPGVTRSTMMGLPCLRFDGAFFASWDRRTGDLLVKLPAPRVAALVATGQAVPFAPAGRTFREWAAVPYQRAPSWPALLDEALGFVAGDPSGPTIPEKKQRRRRTP